MKIIAFIKGIGATLVLPIITAITEISASILIQKESPDLNKVVFEFGKKILVNIGYWLIQNKGKMWKSSKVTPADILSPDKNLEKEYDDFFNIEDSLTRDYTLVDFDPEMFKSTYSDN